MRIDLRRSLRRIKPEQRRGTLRRRPDAELSFAGPDDLVGPALLLDTTVYVDVLQGSTPPEVDEVLKARQAVHLSVVLGELSHNFGRLDPKDPRTPAVVAALTGVFDDIRPHRVEENVGAGLMVEAGILAGLLHRLGGGAPGRELAALNDATLYLHALENGHAVLTGNIRDFDFLQQLMPGGRVLFYRAA